MMRILVLIAAIISVVLTATADRRGLFSVGDSATSYLINEDFEGTGNPGWTVGGAGTKNFDNTTNVLAGAQSFAMVGASSAYTNFTDSAEVWASFRLKVVDILATDNSYVFRIRDSSGNDLLLLRIFDQTADFSCTLYHGSATAAVSDSALPFTQLYVWIHYAKGTGANGVGDVEFSATSTRSGSGTRFASTSSGTATADAGRMHFNFADPTWSIIVDNLKVSNTGYPTQ